IEPRIVHEILGPGRAAEEKSNDKRDSHRSDVVARRAQESAALHALVIGIMTRVAPEVKNFYISAKLPYPYYSPSKFSQSAQVPCPSANMVLLIQPI